MSAAVLSLYALDPAMPVLLRPDGAVQVGWDPRRAVLVRPPCGLPAADDLDEPAGFIDRGIDEAIAKLEGPDSHGGPVDN